MPPTQISASRRRFAWILGDILILSLVLSSPSASPIDDSFKSPDPHSNQDSNTTSPDSFQSDPVGPKHSQLSDLTSLFYYKKEQTNGETAGAATTKQPYQILNEHRADVRISGRGEKKRGETPSTDCYTKRAEILNKLKTTTPTPKVRQNQPKFNHDAPAFQRLRPNLDNTHSTAINATSAAFDGEHVPQCTQDGRFEPIQCHKLIGYCWCVNKFGQAIKNSAALAGERPVCNKSIYESESNDLLVVAGVSAQRIKNFLKGGSSTPTSLNATSPTIPDSDSDQIGLGQDPRQVIGSPEEDFNRRVSNSQEPRLLLAPYDCASSQNHARDRASKHTDDSIWVPECSAGDSRLYAEKQCHKSKVCWCVDQATGLPLRTNQQLAKHLSINCTNRSSVVPPTTNQMPQPERIEQHSVFAGFSEWCEADLRADFVASLVSQFRHQIGDYLRANPTASAPEGFKTSNPFRLNDFQIAQWKFSTMDLDRDGKLNDREWNKFKVSFKLVDKFDDSHRSTLSDPPSSHSVPTTSPSPLIITRDQRRCWRDFLEFCGNGDLFTDESISISKWLNCTELPSDSHPISHGGNRGRGADSLEDNIHASTREAAIVRSKMKNPFLGILKPD